MSTNFSDTDIKTIIEIYKKYGFIYHNKYANENVHVFTLQNGYFDNADIVSLGLSGSEDKAFDEFTKIGFACTRRSIKSSKEIEDALFKGFFFVESIKERLKEDYKKFIKSITSPYSDDANYEYINVPYSINDKESKESIIDEITSKLNLDKPVLFLIEAAAGFGKTCTAYELVNKILKNENMLPLFSELSRNRSAKIFRYVLLDEIDRTFPQLKSKLVEEEISNGKVIVILDGFDELLRKSDGAGAFEKTEPMLETISELLHKKSKIILTTRRTVLFEGDEFYQWAEQHSNDFQLVKVKLNEPCVNDWLNEKRLSTLISLGFDINSIANPVLLSYLRCISEDDFSKVVLNQDTLINKYFNFMLERERVRQDLRLSPEDQYSILKDIAKDMMEYRYTSESRDYILDLIFSMHSQLLDKVRGAYAAAEKPTKDEIANKLASHALLDKSSNESTKIGFINEFVFGNFIVENIFDTDTDTDTDTDDIWYEEDLRFLEPAVFSYIPRSIELKNKLWNKIEFSLDFVDTSSKIKFSALLNNSISFLLENSEAESLILNKLIIGNFPIESFQFNDCQFKDCQFDIAKLKNVTFLNCKFYDCSLTETTKINQVESGPIFIMGCSGNTNIFDGIANTPSISINSLPDYGRDLIIDRFILERFWPIGMQTFLYKHRHINTICKRNNEYNPIEIYEGISRLKKRKILLEPNKPSFVELNLDKITEIKDILGRN